ncbi:Hsp70 family protein [Nocardia cyriacigeorgica]|uniref:Hsp70 family protein n=1 Tax=Nocardia cyriacigeorgica TaxID=135487 RepID=UPI001895FEDF|nr:Hsp70 family protein [Nocardia cyriacigeorgica]MBF6517902.1 Hsp70 family protein [Nocardia cyriacigeorgica]
MTTGLGFSIGTVNSVSAVATAEQPRPTVRTRRTTAAFDGSGVRLGAIPEFAGAVTDFADLARDPDSVTIGGRIWSPANMIAAVVHGLLAAAEPSAGVVATYPAAYSNKQVALLRQALELSGIGHVELVPEPVAAAEWLEREHGPLPSEFVLVYDLGGNSLDVTVVRVGPDWPDHPMVGNPVRCYDFGGRPLGAMIARYAGGKTKSAGRVAMTSIVDTDGLRVEQVRDSLEVVRAAVGAAGITMSDIGRILVIGGAARPPEVARTLAELGKPVIMSADPGQTVAAGAAYIAARTATPAAPGASFHPPVFSGAAIVSAIAMSAATMFGSGTVDTQLSPVLDRFPRLDIPRDALLVELDGSALTDHDLARHLHAVGYTASGVVRSVSAVPARLTGYAGMVSSSAYSRPHGPTMAESRGSTRIDSHSDTRHWRHRTDESGTYADPARFRNPMPFSQPDRTVRPPSDPVDGTPSTPGLPGAGDGSSPVPGTPGSVPGGATGPDTAEPGTTPGVPTAPGDTTVPGGTAPGGTTGGIPAGDPTPGGVDVPGGSTGSDGPGGTPSGGGSGDGASSGTDSSDGGSAGGGTGGAAAGGATGGSSGAGSGGSASAEPARTARVRVGLRRAVRRRAGPRPVVLPPVVPRRADLPPVVPGRADLPPVALPPAVRPAGRRRADHPRQAARPVEVPLVELLPVAARADRPAEGRGARAIRMGVVHRVDRAVEARGAARAIRTAAARRAVRAGVAPRAAPADHAAAPADPVDRAGRAVPAARVAVRAAAEF